MAKDIVVFSDGTGQDGCVHLSANPFANLLL